jgi:hypothetical protein
MLLSDVGGGADLNGVNLTFDDEAVGGLPDGQQITAGTYKPTEAMAAPPSSRLRVRMVHRSLRSMASTPTAPTAST